MLSTLRELDALLVDGRAHEPCRVAGREPAQTAKMFTPAEDVSFAEGGRIVRHGQRDLGIHVIVTGDVGLAYEDEELAILPQGSFFGGISALLGEPAFADVISPDP